MRSIRSLSVCLCILLLKACSTVNLDPLHYEVIEQETSEETILQYFHQWEDAGGLQRPNSTFTLWKTSDEYMRITTPASWHGNALRAKAEFKKTALETIRANQYSTQNPEELPQGEYHVFIDGKEWTTSARPQTAPYHSLCIIDLSGDAQREDAEAMMTQSYQQWLISSSLKPGSTWRVVLTGQTRDTAKLLGTITLEEKSPAQTYLFAQESYQHIALPEKADPNSSAIIEALNYGVSLFEENGALPQTVSIRSDMREINHAFNFSKSIPDAQEFRNWLQQEVMTMDFQKASIHIHGLSHTGGGDEYTAKEYHALVHFWKTYFQETNAGTITLTSREGGQP